MNLSREEWKLLQALADRLSESRRVIVAEELAEATGLSWHEISAVLLRLIDEGCLGPHPRGGIRVTFNA